MLLVLPPRPDLANDLVRNGGLRLQDTTDQKHHQNRDCSMENEPSKLPEFIFGKLSTAEGRLQRVKTKGWGLNAELCLNPLDPAENELIEITVRVGADMAVKAVTLHYSTDGSLPQVNPENLHPSTMTLAMQRKAIEWDTLQWSYLEKWIGVIPEQPQGTHVQYAISAITTTNQVIYCPYFLNKSMDDSLLNRFNGDNQPQIYGFYVDNETIPIWLREAVIYQIFVERFAPEPGKQWSATSDLSDFFGGTIKGITAKLDYLSDLGVNCLWLTPIFLSSSHHGYDPISHSLIEPRLGTEADWEMLVKEAHHRGIKIILDYVANHFSNQHPSFKTAQTQPDSKEYHWFRFREWPDDYECFFDVPSQPEVNSENLELRQYLISNACQWLEKGCDGFRLDYAHGLSQAFWSIFRNTTRKLKPDSVTLAEITQPPDFMRSFTGRMDGCLDFKLLELFRGFFAFNTLTVSQFERQLRQHLAYFGNSLVLPSFLDNHDMNRFLWVVKGDKRRLQLAALCQFSLPSPPIIYYGTEVGLSQLREVGRLEESRLPMLWGEEQDRDLFSFYQQLIAWRRENNYLWRQSTQPKPLIIYDQQGVYVYGCGNYAIALNNSPQGTTVILTEGKQGSLVLKTQSEVNWDTQTGNLDLPAYGGAITRLTH